jgi:hypothetical protein
MQRGKRGLWQCSGKSHVQRGKNTCVQALTLTEFIPTSFGVSKIVNTFTSLLWEVIYIGGTLEHWNMRVF